MSQPAKASLAGRMFVRLTDAPFLRKTLWRSWYGFLARRYTGREWTFMNYGFADPDRSVVRSLLPEDEPDRLSMQLYDHVAGAADLRGKRVVEVGSGRGGGASFIHRYLGPSRTVGFDLARAAVAFSRDTHKVDGLEFQAGEAQRLPLESQSVDVVVNVESSHCYPSMDAFALEVARLLKPGGYFLHADFRDVADAAAWRQSILDAGFEIERETDITSNVMAALRADHQRKQEWISRMIPVILRRPFSEFAALEGTSIYEAFRSGRLVYKSFAAFKR